MKQRFTAILALLLLLLPSLAAAEDRLDVTDEGSYLPGDPPLFVPGPPFATWVPYRDGRRISEAEFYRILGYEEMGKEAGAWRTRKTILGWAGLGSLGLGLGAALLTGFLGGDRVGDLPFYLGSASLAAGGGLWIGYLSMGFNFRPYAEAQKLAAAYNQAGNRP